MDVVFQLQKTQRGGRSVNNIVFTASMLVCVCVWVFPIHCLTYYSLLIYIMEKNTLAVPLAIVVSAVIIAGAIFFVTRGPSTQPGEESTGSFTQPEAISESDHILGNPNSELVYIEYSDFECPFCSLFHETMNALITEFGTSGRVAWTYRHFPLPIQGHQNAPKIAEGSECAAELGGNDAFWAYTNGIFEQDVQNVATPLSVIPEVAEEVGLDVTAFTQCLDSGKYESKVRAQFDDARDAGGNGTPYTIALLEEKVTEGQKSDIQLLANQLRVPLNLITFAEDETAVALSGNLPLSFMRAFTQILLGLPVGDDATNVDESAPAEDTTDTIE